MTEYAIQKMTPLISIIVVVRNGAETLAACLESIVGQTLASKEVIVIDGASTDGTVDILKNYDSHLSFWLSEPDFGIANAWNKGLAHAAGSWIVFIGADDRLHDPFVLETMAPILKEDEKSDLIYGQTIFADGRFSGRILGQPFDWNIQKRRMLVPHNSCLHRKSLFGEIGSFDESYKIAMDYELILRKPKIECKFVPRLFTLMGGSGLSTRQNAHALREGRRAQLKNGVGPRHQIELWHLIYRIRDSVRNMGVG